MTRRVYRHGDVNLIAVSAAEFEAAQRRGRTIAHEGRYVLARGEATGSVHELSVADATAMTLVQDGDVLWLRLTTPGTLTHTSDHETLAAIASDYYRQVSERECDHFADSVVRRVVD